MTTETEFAEDIRSMGQLEAWTVRRMLQLDVPADDAVELARAGVSWHEVEGLIARGCPPALVSKVL